MSSHTHTDTRFFTNTEANTLLGRFQDSIVHAQYFDVLVGARKWLETQGEGEHFAPALPVTDRKLLHMLKSVPT